MASTTVVLALRPTQAASAPAVAMPLVLNQPKRRVPKPGETYVCEVDGPEIMKLLNRLMNEVHQGMLGNPHPSTDMLLSVTQLNVLRAMSINLAALNLSMEDIKQDIVSRFNDPDYNDELHLSQVPPTLHPTNLQKSIIHHPWTDPFPLPSLRDALLLAHGSYDDVELCNDLAGQCGPGSKGQVGIIIWGEPWDPHGWELTREFAQKWLWLFGGCKELLESTNYWRVRRGEGRLFRI
jgi:hypothetical protein